MDANISDALELLDRIVNEEYSGTEYYERYMKVVTNPKGAKRMSDNKDKWPSEGLIGAVARGWCSEANENKTMDPDLAFDIVTSVHRYLQDCAAQPVVLSAGKIDEIGRDLQPMKDRMFREARGQQMTSPEREEYEALHAFARAIESTILAAKEQA